MYNAMVAIHLWIYYLMGHNPVTCRASSTSGHSYPPSPARRYVFPVISLSTWWQQTYITVNIATVTTHISLSYSDTFWTIALHIITHERTDDPTFVSTFATIPHHRRYFLILWYRADQLLLLYETVWSRYRKSAVGSIVSAFTLMSILVASKQCWRVSRRLRHYSPRWHLSDS